MIMKLLRREVQLGGHLDRLSSIVVNQDIDANEQHPQWKRQNNPGNPVGMLDLEQHY